MNLIIIGPPGSGKGTQAKIIAEKLNLFYLGSGDLARQLAQNDSGIKDIVEKGDLVPEEVMTQYVEEYLEENVKDFDNLLFDGYPRFLNQYQLLEGWLKTKGAVIDHVIYLNIPQEEVVRRISARRMDKKTGEIYNLITNPPPEGVDNNLVHRTDDKPEVIKERMKVFIDNTYPVMEYAKSTGKLLEVDGTLPIEKVTQKILESI